MNPGELDCTKCGACCVTNKNLIEARGKPFVRVFPEDRRRLPSKYKYKLESVDARLKPLVHAPHVLPLKKLKVLPNAQACTAFVGKPGKHAICDMYAQRPEQCRNLKVGSEACHQARFDILGIETPVAKEMTR